MKTVETAEKGQEKLASEESKKDSKPGVSTETPQAGPSTRPEIIKKYPVKANLEDYETTYASFSWEDAKKKS
ncbi:MAG TPA: hypothetical protein V6C97_15160 [Oculatellaceae cyanobacterium]